MNIKGCPEYYVENDVRKYLANKLHYVYVSNVEVEQFGGGKLSYLGAGGGGNFPCPPACVAIHAL